jgi:Signal transduction histidine kinase
MTMNRIGFKLGAAILGLMIVVLVFSGLAVDRLFANFYDAQMKENTREIAVHFATMAETDDTSSRAMIRTFAKFSDVKAYWVTFNGKIQTVSDVLQTNPSILRSQETQRLLSGRSVELQNNDAQGRRFFVVGEPIKSNHSAHAAIYIISSMKKVDDSLQRLRNLLILSGVGAFLLASGMILIISKLLSGPLLQMQKMTEKMAKGHWNTRLPARSHDEIGMLGNSINDLAASLQRYRDTRQAFFSNVSHELRTPVTYLQGYSKVLNDGLVTSEQEKKQYLTIIYQESVRLEHLIHDLFDLAKMEEGRITMTLNPLDLKTVIREAIQKVSLKADKKQLSLQMDLHDEVPLIRGDHQRMEQVILNLLENAIRYTEKGYVLVRLKRENSTVLLSVSDSGIGIPKDKLPYIFERFYRVEKSRARQYGGTGLGLSIVKKYTELQGGTIQAESQMGKGTTVTLSFPDEKESGKGV